MFTIQHISQRTLTFRPFLSATMSHVPSITNTDRNNNTTGISPGKPGKYAPLHTHQQTKPNKPKVNSAWLAQHKGCWDDNMVLCDYAQNERTTKHKQLLVLDLNGTLILRGAHTKAKGMRGRMGYTRPYLKDFMDFVLEHFAVMVWSSAQPFSIDDMLSLLMKPYQKRLVRVWDRRFCGIEGDYFSKVQTIKDLVKITNGYTLANSPHANVFGSYRNYLGMAPEMKDHWKLEDILLIDDSEVKASLQKDNHIYVSTYKDTTNDDELVRLRKYLEAYVEQKADYSNLVDYVKQRPWMTFGAE